MKTIIVKTKRVVSHSGDGMPVYETIDQKLSPELTFDKFCKYLPNQRYVSAKVIGVIESIEKDGKFINTDIDEIEKYQSKIDNILMPKKEVKADLAAENKELKSTLEKLQERLEALENKTGKSIERELIESKAKELNISFRSTISDEKLIEKIKDIEPEFNLN